MRENQPVSPGDIAAAMGGKTIAVRDSANQGFGSWEAAKTNWWFRRPPELQIPDESPHWRDHLFRVNEVRSVVTLPDGQVCVGVETERVTDDTAERIESTLAEFGFNFERMDAQ